MLPEGEKTGESQDLNLSGHISENTTSSSLHSFFCAPIPINGNNNLSVNPGRSPYMCELSHWCVGSSMFEWSPD